MMLCSSKCPHHPHTFGVHAGQIEYCPGIMTPEQVEEQRRSFAYGNLKLSNPSITRADIDRAAEMLDNLRERGEHE